MNRNLIIFGYDRINADGSYTLPCCTDCLLSHVDGRWSMHTIRNNAVRLCKARGFIAYSVGYLTPCDDGSEQRFIKATKI